ACGDRGRGAAPERPFSRLHGQGDSVVIETPPSTQSLGLFVLACLLLAITPGPNLLYLVSRTLCQGRRAGIVSLAGTSFGFVFHVLAAALGLSAIFLTVPLLYDLLRYAGAAYLLWLAWSAVRPGGQGTFTARILPQDPPGR